MLLRKAMLACSLLVLAGFVTGCKKESTTAPEESGSTGTLTFTLNGGGFSNRVITLSTAVARYDAGEDETAIAAGGISGTDSLTCSVVFRGNRTGTFSWSSPDYGFAVAFSSGNRVYFPTSGSTTVSAYGAVGSAVSGTFSGTVTHLGTTETVTVSNGQFSATRIP